MRGRAVYCIWYRVRLTILGVGYRKILLATPAGARAGQIPQETIQCDSPLGEKTRFPSRPPPSKQTSHSYIQLSYIQLSLLLNGSPTNWHGTCIYDPAPARRFLATFPRLERISSMYTMKRISDDWYEAAAPLEGLVAAGPTRADAADQLRTTLAIKRFATSRLRRIRQATQIFYDPQVRSYVADCAAAGIEARGFTRQDAWDNLLKALRLVDMARAAAEPIDLTEGSVPSDGPTEEHGQDQEGTR